MNDHDPEIQNHLPQIIPHSNVVMASWNFIVIEQRVSHVLKLEFQVVVSCQMWVLGTRLGFSAGAVRAPSVWVFFSTVTSLQFWLIRPEEGFVQGEAFYRNLFSYQWDSEVYTLLPCITWLILNVPKDDVIISKWYFSWVSREWTYQNWECASW